MATVKDKFTNRSEGFIGVIAVDSRGEHRAVAVPPGDDVWLSEEEQALTANAPRNPADNPLANGQLELVTEGVEIKNARPLRPVRPVEDEDADVAEETGAAPLPAGPAEEGSRPPAEEVGTPDAVSREDVVRENVEAAAASRRARPKPKAVTA